jgi:hypothetical protein
MPVGFWDSFFDNDYRQRSDINDLRNDAAYVAADIEGVRAHCFRLQRQVGDLSVLVSVLVKVLEENGQLDPKVLRYRVEAELEALAAARMQGPGSLGESLRGGAPQASPPEPQAPTTPTTCGKCGQVVPANRTTITESGVVCDGCAAR